LIASCGQETSSEKAGTTEVEPAETTESVTEKTSESSSTAQVPGVYFPRQKAGGGFPDAMSGGMLSVDEEGCLRMLSNGNDYSTTLIWRFDMSLDVRDGKVVVLNKDGKVVAREGVNVAMGGGELPNLNGVQPVSAEISRELQEHCPGEYWLVGIGVSIPKEKTEKTTG